MQDVEEKTTKDYIFAAALRKGSARSYVMSIGMRVNLVFPQIAVGCSGIPSR
jgi:hypothetical protein